MYCPDCGRQNPDEARFCTACGESVVATAYPPSLPKSETSGPAVRPESDASRPSPSLERTLRYLVYRGLVIAIALLILGLLILGLLIPGLLIGNRLGPEIPLLGVIVTTLGAFLWVGAKGRWPGRRGRVNPVVRAVVGVVAVAVNALIGFAAGFLYYVLADTFRDGASPAIAVGIGLGFFVGVSALEALAILLFVWAVKIVRYLWRAADYDGTSYESSALEG